MKCSKLSWSHFRFFWRSGWELSPIEASNSLLTLRTMNFSHSSRVGAIVIIMYKGGT
uniref:Uncharacterized protein n=1 Tax=Lepeophtheirus salmonis TaxID=72036 RepID=A0A0K2TNP0_LEPSM